MDVLSLLYWLIVLFLAFLTVRWFLERFQIPDLERRAVLITGCDSGFGRALAIHCAEKGMPVFAGCMLSTVSQCDFGAFERPWILSDSLLTFTIKAPSVSEIRNLSKNFSTPIDAFVMDVTSDESVLEAKKYVEKCTAKYGGLHGLVNNAGILGRSFFDDFLTLADYKEVAEVNLWGVIRVTQALKSLVKKTRGRIVTVTSVCSRLGLMGIGPYTAAKFAVSGYCDVIRSELRMFGVSVHVLEPGFFNTHLTTPENVEKQIDAVYSKCPDETKLEYGQHFLVEMRQKTSQMLSAISSDRIDLVTDAYFHALTAAFPRSRYQVGWDCILVYVPFSFLPTGIQDMLIWMLAKIIRIPTPSALKKKK